MGTLAQTAHSVDVSHVFPLNIIPELTFSELAGDGDWIIHYKSAHAMAESKNVIKYQMRFSDELWNNFHWIK